MGGFRAEIFSQNGRPFHRSHTLADHGGLID
jgi:hypothetical protein